MSVGQNAFKSDSSDDKVMRVRRRYVNKILASSSLERRKVDDIEAEGTDRILEQLVEEDIRGKADFKGCFSVTRNSASTRS